MAEGGQELPEVGDVPLENIEEDLNKLYFQTVIDAGAKGAIMGPEEIIEDFALVLGDRIGGKTKSNRFLFIKNSFQGGNEAIQSATYVLSSAVMLTIVQSVLMLEQLSKISIFKH